MNTNKKTIKSKIIATIVAVFMLIANGGMALINFAKDSISNFVFADYQPTEVSLSNGSFTTPSSGTYPLTPSSWTKLVEANGVTSGIISLDETDNEKIKNSYKLDKVPYKWTGISDSQVLMINSESMASSNGYKSSSISLSNSGFYEISFKAYTTSGDYSAFGSAKLTGNDTVESDSNNLVVINTNDSASSNWKTYSIFVETNDIESPTVYLELWLGVEDGQQSQGAIFFDDVKVVSYDNNTYNTKIASSSNSKIINLSENSTIKDLTDTKFISNPNFEQGLTGWQVCDEVNSTNTIHDSVYIEQSNYNSNLTDIADCPTNANIYQNKKALLINNKVNGYFGYKSSTFTVEQNKFYKLSFIAKTNSLDNDAVVKLIERNPYTNKYLSDGTTLNKNYYENSTYEAQTFTISDIDTSAYTNSKTNDWKLYSFYIKSSVYLDSELNLEIWLGTKDKTTIGHIFIDNFTLSEISSSIYTNGSSNGTIANLNQNTTETDFANGTFNLFTTTSVNDTYPYTPTSWTLSQDNTSAQAKNGIINTSKDNSSLGIPSITAINETYKNNNVLMIGNISNNKQTYTSNTVSLNADSYYKIEVSVLTNQLNGANAGIRLLTDSNILGEKLNIQSDNTWTTYTLFVKTGYESKNVSLVLSLGQNSKGTGFAFFDNVILTKDLTQEDYNTSLLNSVKIDMSQFTFDNTPENSSSTKGLFTPYDFTTKNNNNANEATITAGVIDTSNYGQTNGYSDSNFANPGHADGQDSKVLMIKSLDDTYYTFTNNLAKAVTSGEYYQIDVDVKTSNLKQDETNVKYSDSEKKKVYPFGASISIDGIDAQFTGIVSDEYKTYTMYIKCTTDANIKLVLGLGSENAYTSGAVYFSNAKVSKIDSTKYEEGIAKLDVSEDETAPDNILAIGNTDEKKDDSSTNTDNNVNFDWLIVPSLITALAIVIAVVGVLVRNIKKNAPKKVVLEKEYSAKNLKKLDDARKSEIKEVDLNIAKLNRQQDNLAILINKKKLEKTDESREQLEKLKVEYENNNKKISDCELQKLEINKTYKHKVDDLMQIKKADEKLKRSRK